MKKASGFLSVEVWVDCPNCEMSISLLTETDLNDEGDVLREVCNDTQWGTDNLGMSAKCPKCKEHFKIGAISW